MMEGYDKIIKEARDAYSRQESSGWKLARLTWEAVTGLVEDGTTKEAALTQWSDDLDRPGFSPTNARRYFTIWEEYGEEDKRLKSDVPEGRPLTFAEHYAAVKGGQKARERLQRGESMRSAARTPTDRQEQAQAREEAKAAALRAGAPSPTDSASFTEDEIIVPPALRTRLSNSVRALEEVLSWAQQRGEGLTDVEVKELDRWKASVDGLLTAIGEWLPLPDEEEVTA